MSNDIAVSVSNRFPIGSPVLIKPSYLIKLEEKINSKTIQTSYFISLDKPELLNGFVQVKGIFADSALKEEDIINRFSELLTGTKKELFLEMLFPWHKICSIRSLVFKAK
jgi:hypothetical protein